VGTERDQVEVLREELERTRADLERARRAREDLLAIVSHDLRNPLGSITTSAEMLRRLAGTPNATVERLGKYLDLIDRAAERMNRWVRDLLDLSRFDAGALTIQVAAHPAAPMVREIVERFGPLAAAKAIVIKVHAGDVIVRCDRERIVQVLSNLVGNAIRFTPEGGRVAIGATATEAGVRFSVVDTGAGVEPDQLANIFDRYWQGNRSGIGAGLGLSIAKALIELHGGRIWVDTPPGGGAAFCFTLPA